MVTRITFNLFADSWYRMRNSYSPLRRLFPLRCLSYLSPHTSTWWLCLNVPSVKKELRRISFFNTIYPVRRLPQEISPVQFWNVVTGENHRVQQCLNQTVWRNIVILSSELSVSWLQETCLHVKWRSCSMSKQNLPYPFKTSLSLVKVIKPNAKLIQLKLN